MSTNHKLKMIYTRIRGKSMKKDKLINKIIYRLSYSGRRERNLKETSDNISKYMNMSDNEFIMEYTEVCSRYEHKKLILTVISIGLIISMISNIWKYFYEFLMKIFTSKSIAVVDVKNQAIVLSLIIILMISLVVLFITYNMVKTIYVLNKKKILLNQVKDMRMSS